MKRLILTALLVMPTGAAFAQQTHDLKGDYSDNVIEQYSSVPTLRPDNIATASLGSMRMPADQTDRQIEAERLSATQR